MEPGHKLAVIVEDDPDVRNLLRTVLTQSGFETILTSNGEDGVAAVRMHNPVLTTLDVSMPGMDGVAAAAAIRQFSDTYIIMITAQDEEIDVISGLNAGADEYLAKPFRPRELRARIASLLRRPRGPIASEDDGGADDGLWRRPAEGPAPEPAVAQAPQAVQYQPPVTAQPVQQVQQYQAPQPVRYVEAPAAPFQPVQYAEPTAPPMQQPVQYAAPVQQPAPPAVTHPPVGQAHSTGHAFSADAPSVSPAAGQSLASGEGVFSHNGLNLDSASRQVTVEGNRIDLAPEEFDLLRSLMATGRRVRSKADLVLAARGESYVTSYFVTEHDKRVIDQQVASVRRKLHDEVEPGRWIETVAGVGYRMAP